jgi:hypothetical protein
MGISVPISGSGGAQKRSENPAGFTFAGTSAAALAGCGGSGRGGGGAGRGGGTMGGALGRLGGALGRGGGGLAGWLTATSEDRVMPETGERGSVGSVLACCKAGPNSNPSSAPHEVSAH